jgi:hypothetical protein
MDATDVLTLRRPVHLPRRIPHSIWVEVLINADEWLRPAGCSYAANGRPGSSEAPFVSLPRLFGLPFWPGSRQANEAVDARGPSPS